MASPQKENGYAAISKELLQAIARARFGPAEAACLWCIVDATYGWNRKRASISRQDFVNYTGYSYRQLKRALAVLDERKIITRDNSRPIRYSVQKDYERWHPAGVRVDPLRVPSDAPPLQEETSTVAKATAGRAANAIVENVTEIGLHNVRPANWAKQHKAALRLIADGATPETARKACLGLRKLFPWSGGVPFDVFDLERHWAKATALASQSTEKHHPCGDKLLGCGQPFPESQMVRTELAWWCRRCAWKYNVGTGHEPSTRGGGLTKIQAPAPSRPN